MNTAKWAPWPTRILLGMVLGVSTLAQDALGVSFVTCICAEPWVGDGVGD